MQDGVDIHAWTQIAGKSLLPSPLDDLGDREVRPIGVLSMEEGGGDPHLIRHLQLVPDFAGLSWPGCLSHTFNVCLYETKIKSRYARCSSVRGAPGASSVCQSVPSGTSASAGCSA